MTVLRNIGQLATCPETNQHTKDGARAQCLAWYLSASCAAGRVHYAVVAARVRIALAERAGTEPLSGGALGVVQPLENVGNIHRGIVEQRRERGQG